MNFFLQIINKAFNLNLSKQQLFFKAEKFFSQSQFKILLVFTFLCFIFLCCMLEPIAVTLATFCYGFLYLITHTLTLFKVPIFLFTFAAVLATEFCTVKQYISLVLLLFIFFLCFCYFFKDNFFVLKLDPNLREVFFENFEEEKTKFLCFEVLLTLQFNISIVECILLLAYKAELSSFYNSLNLEYATLIQSFFLSLNFFVAASFLLSCLILAICGSLNYIKDFYYCSLFLDIFCVFGATLFFLLSLFLILF